MSVFILNRNKIIKPWNTNFRAFSILVILLFCNRGLSAQNVLEKVITAEQIDTVSIHANQIFKVSISSSKTDKIKIVSRLDGEYQNEYQVVPKEIGHTLHLGLEQLSFTDIPDDKRNAHKVIAATLFLEIPEDLSLVIESDIGSVDLNGNFNALFIQLLRGQCVVRGEAKTAIINTFDGVISVVTESATVNASSNHGNISIAKFSNVISTWKLKSINGNITVAKPN